jgi:quercetin dioxygenase-like cupin family protein
MSSDLQAPVVTVVQPGVGRQDSIGSIDVVFKLFSKDTGGGLSIVEHNFPVGALVPPHLHTREDEYSIVAEGEIGFRSDESEVVLGSGGYIVKPRGELHTMWNAGKVPARMIEVLQPGGFEGYFWDLVEQMAAGAPDPAVISRLAEAHGLFFKEAPWLPDIIARYDLTPPPPRRPEAGNGVSL